MTLMQGIRSFFSSRKASVEVRCEGQMATLMLRGTFLYRDTDITIQEIRRFLEMETTGFIVNLRDAKIIDQRVHSEIFELLRALKNRQLRFRVVRPSKSQFWSEVLLSQLDDVTYKDETDAVESLRKSVL